MWRHAYLLYLCAASAASQTQTATSQSPPQARAVTSSPITSTSLVSASLTPVASTRTCENLSINYVTHRLPQQCLGRTSSPYTPPSGSNTTSSTPSQSPASSESSAKPNVTNNDAYISSTSSIITISTPLAVQATPLSVPTDQNQANDAEEESLLDNAKFLSFEDWKKQNIAQKGIPDHGKAAPADGRERRRPGINNALEGLGEDAEIEIDFGFGSHEPVNHASLTDKAAASEAASASAGAPPNQKRSKDAGKTCKERFNYASFDCAANVLKTNPKSKSASSVLVENKDSYMLNECSQDNKFVIVELCESVLIDTLVLANFEFFSSMFRNFRVSVSDRYPVKADKWIDLGTFEARNSRDIQPFLIETSPDTFARYLRIEFLSHYGSEYYCPLSLIRVHGITMFEQYRMSISTDNDDHEDEEVAVAEASHELSVPVAPVAAEVKEKLATPVVADTAEAKVQQSPSAQVAVGEALSPTPSVTSTADVVSDSAEHGSAADMCICLPDMSVDEAIMAPFNETCLIAPVTAGPKSLEETSSAVTTSVVSSAGPKAEQPVTTSASINNSNSANSTSASSPSKSSSSLESKPASKSASKPSGPASVTEVTTSTAIVSVSSSGPTASSSPPVVTPATPSVPATQESFFKSVHNRLSLLEANSTLSLQYIESQSQLLREAFSKVEKRNAATTSKFLDMLNSTVLAELARYKGEYEQIWQSTVLELASQRDEGRRERELLGERVRLLAEEMVAQKRLMAAQAILLLLCLSIVVFAKFGTAGVDSSLVQGVQELVSMRRGRRRGASQMDGKGQHHRLQGTSLSLGRRWPWESPWTSPPRSRDITRPQTATGLADEQVKRLHDDKEDLSDSAGEVTGLKRRLLSKLASEEGQSSSDTDDGRVERAGHGRDADLVHDGDGRDGRHDHVPSDEPKGSHDDVNGSLSDGAVDVSGAPSISAPPLGLGLEGLDGIENPKKQQQLAGASRSAPATPQLDGDDNGHAGGGNGQQRPRQKQRPRGVGSRGRR